jgi:prepilin-type N-terminal cleavage/methylation domain-containing protein
LDLDRRRDLRQRGVTLPELLVVVTIVALAVAIAVPIIGGAVRSANARVAANYLSVNLRAARMIAVSANRTVQFTIRAEPHARCSCTPTYYEYRDMRNQLRHFEMPSGVTIASATSSSILFQPNGGSDGPSTTVLRAEVGRGNVELWTIETSVIGVPTVRHSREQS